MAEEISVDVATWAEIRVTAMFTAATTLGCLVVFEVCRRLPLVAPVFDRRRAAKPDRTPPPLNRRRYFEWLFLNTSPGYIEYNRMENENGDNDVNFLSQIIGNVVSSDGKVMGFRLPFNISKDDTGFTAGDNVIEEEPPDELKKPTEDDRDCAHSNNELTINTGGLERLKLDPNTVSPRLAKLFFNEEPGNSCFMRDEQDEETAISKLRMSSSSLDVDQRTESKDKKEHLSAEIVPHITSKKPENIVEVNGKLLPASVAELAISGKLSDAMINRYELLVKRNLEQQAKARHLQHSKADKNEAGVLKRISFGIFGQGQPSSMKQDVTEPKKSPDRFKFDVGFDRDELRRKVSEAWNDSLHRRQLVNRNLSSTKASLRRTISISDQELLRCIGLDMYVMIRFLRFGFDVSFYPFLAACVTLIPTYYTNDYEGQPATETTAATVTAGYFRYTIRRLERGSPRLWVMWLFCFFFYSFVLRRLWVEWETFVNLRFDFLANGDADADAAASHKQDALRRRLAPEDDPALRLQQYRNTCMIENIPSSRRKDADVYEFFDAIFPGQVARAEVLLKADRLSELMMKRKQLILKYENTYATHFHRRQVYRRKIEHRSFDNVGICHFLFCRLCGKEPRKPKDPVVSVGGVRRCFFVTRGGTKVKALPYYLSEIRTLNQDIEKERLRILDEKDDSIVGPTDRFSLRSSFATGLKYVVGGTGKQLRSNTGFVEFKSLTAKQSAIQCNITGSNGYMSTKTAPDPRDIVWQNVTAKPATIAMRKLHCDAVLITGILFWSAIIFFLTSISSLTTLSKWLPAWMVPPKGSFWHGFIQGYLPVVVLEGFMVLVQIILRNIAEKYIRYKTLSDVDQYVFQWHLSYRVANLFFIIVSGSIIKSIRRLHSNPQAFIGRLANGISEQSQFFLNNMIVAAGSETFIELAQGVEMAKHFLLHKWITIEGKSKRALENLEEPPKFEFGENMPNFIFGLLVGFAYCAIVPFVTGIVAIYFWASTKVYTHQALYVYAQPYEGGGKLMYTLSQVIFIILYISICLLATVLGLKGGGFQAPSLLFGMGTVAFFVHQRITEKFIRPSLTLALTKARYLDEEQTYLKQHSSSNKEESGVPKATRQMAQKTSLIGSPAPGFPPEKPGADIPLNGLETTGHPCMLFQVMKEDNADEHRKRMLASLNMLDEEGVDEEENENKHMDFFLYRQPQFNKSLWETKPRPYR